VEPGVTPCLHCLFSSAVLPPNPPPSFAPVVSVVSSLEAQLALDFLLGRPNPLRGRMLVYDGNGLELQKIPIARNERCTVCGNHI
jgi:molybdopterin/thiamine biosynthesis adenylyltransferase